MHEAILKPQKRAKKFCNTTKGSPRNDIWGMTGEIPLLMMCLCPDLGSASDWLCHKGNLLQPIRNTTQAWVVTRRQYGISTLIFQVAFQGETSGGAAKGQLFLVFSQAINILLNFHNVGWSSLKFPETDNCVNFTLEEKWVNNRDSWCLLYLQWF